MNEDRALFDDVHLRCFSFLVVFFWFTSDIKYSPASVASA
jgi:hypothetical protein